MDLSDLRRLVDAFEDSDWDEVHLISGGVEIRLSAGGETTIEATRPYASLDAEEARPAPPPVSTGNEIRQEPQPSDTTDKAEFAPKGEGTPVTAPSPGVFWRAPAPGEPPFVEVGSRVEPDTVICIVELMKLMTKVIARTSGTVNAIPIENGQSVEKGETLLYVEPSEAQ